MSEAHTDQLKPRSQSQPVEFRVPARLESLAVIRTLVSALGTLEDLDLDAIADLRLALDEACTRLIRNAAPHSTLIVDVEPHEADLRISVSTTCISGDVLRPGTFSWHVISALTDYVQTFHDGTGPDGSGVFGITMIARRLDTAT
jgi:serine/threonine-protein kinase RsbW